MKAKTLGEFVREERDKLDISLRELSRRIGVSPPFLSDIELGRRYPSDDTLKLLAQEFKVTIDALKQFDNRESLNDFKKLVEDSADLSFAFRSAMKKVKTGKLTTDDLAEILTKGKKRP